MSGNLSGQIKRLLVANRGEIACRIMRTAKRMNIDTLAVYSAADKNSMHVKLADESYYLGESEPIKSYLNQTKVLNVAKECQAEAIHPGYGFLSENVEFAEKCQSEKIIFVGPNAPAIRTMGIKNESKRIMIEAGVSVVPGYHGLDQSNERLLSEADAIGYPVMIKPVRGGGGKGMRIVRKHEEFIEALESSRRESIKSFGDETMLLERFIEKPRHVEVQVFGDMHGNYVYLYERDCSVQRRHQKIIEEAPAPLLSESKRQDLGRQAVAAARAVNYVGAGTVEFIYDKGTELFYFMEMNTRLQVEHPITEMITGTDLVEWQLRVARGEVLPKRQDQISITGHAFEARIYAENPSDNFLPQIGKLKYIRLPDDSSVNSHSQSPLDRKMTRLDTGVTSGDSISPYYDPMISKLVVWADDREKALDKLDKALRQYTIVGIPTNISFLQSLAGNKSFKAADVGTNFIDLHYDELFNRKVGSFEESLRKQDHLATNFVLELSAAVFKLVRDCSRRNLSSELTSFRLIEQSKPDYNIKLKFDQQNLSLTYSSIDSKSGELCVKDPQDPNQVLAKIVFEGIFMNDGTIQVTISDHNITRKFKSMEDSTMTDVDGGETLVVLRNNSGDNHVYQMKYENIFSSQSSAESINGTDPLLACAPMPGIIEKVLVLPGDIVTKDQSLVIMSAMKMEYTIKSLTDGQVETINFQGGQFVSKDAILVKLKASD